MDSRKSSNAEDASAFGSVGNLKLLVSFLEDLSDAPSGPGETALLDQIVSSLREPPDRPVSTAQDIYTGGEYLEKNPSWHVEESPFKAKYILALLKRNQLTPGTVCEAGCGAGEVLKQLQERMDPGCEFWGYDISPAAHALSKSRENKKLHFQLGDAGKESRHYFDLLLVLDVVEHLEDYFTFLRGLRGLARHVIFHIPLDLSVQAVLRKNGLMKRREAHAHLHYFTKELVLQTLRETGYQVQDYFYLPRSNEIGTELIQKVFSVPRAMLFAMNKDSAVRVLGGYSFMVLAK